MVEYEEYTEAVEVPKNTGITGFMKVIESILRLSLVQGINVDARGKISYRRFLRAGEEKTAVGVDFDTVAPYALVRAGTVTELPDPNEHAAVAIAQLFERVSLRQLYPVGFVTAPNTRLWDWYKKTTGITLNVSGRDFLYGVPVYTDRHFEPEHLFLCGAFARDGALIDARESYKIVIPEVARDS